MLEIVIKVRYKKNSKTNYDVFCGKALIAVILEGNNNFLIMPKYDNELSNLDCICKTLEIAKYKIEKDFTNFYNKLNHVKK